MAFIRFPGIWETAGREGTDRIREKSGLNLVRDGDDLVIHNEDPCLESVAGPVIEHGDFTHVTEQNYKKIADEFINYLSAEYEAYQGKKPTNVPIYLKSGISAEYKKELIECYFSEPDELRRRLENSTCKFMQENFQCVNAIPLRVNADKQEILLSLAKISLLVDRLGIDEAKRVNFDSKALNNLLPRSAQYLSFFESLLFSSPESIALPISRLGSCLYFLPAKPIVFPHDLNSGLFETFSSELGPLVEDVGTSIYTLGGLSPIQQKRYFLLAIGAINKLMFYINNLKNYVNADESINFSAFVQAHSAIHLIFADLLGMNFSNSQYLKQKMSLSILNKIANLKKFVGRCKGDEPSLFKGLFSYAVEDNVRKIFLHHGRMQGSGLDKFLSNMVRSTYGDIRGFVASRAGGADDESVGEYFSTIRNAGEHGAYLRRSGKFEKTFLKCDGAIPLETSRLPLLLVLAMALDPARFLSEG